MQGISVAKFGGPEVLKLCKDLVLPKPGIKEVLIRVKAAGVNPVDTYIRTGTYARKPALPYTPGSDGAGIVHEIGEGASKFKVGDRVWFTKCLTGSYAEFCTCRESDVFPLPDKVSFGGGAAIGVTYCTAHRALYQKCHGKSGETILIHGASGGVGVAAAQFAIESGLRVFGTVGSAEGDEMLRSMGVHDVFYHNTEDYQDKIMEATSGKGVDIILEMLANVNLGKDLKMLATNGRVAIIGSRGTVEINPRDVMSCEGSIHGVKLMGQTQGEYNDSVEHITRGLQMGWLHPVVGKTYKLEEASTAHKDIIEGGGTKGKMVLLIEDSKMFALL